MHVSTANAWAWTLSSQNLRRQFLHITHLFRNLRASSCVLLLSLFHDKFTQIIGNKLCWQGETCMQMIHALVAVHVVLPKKTRKCYASRLDKPAMSTACSVSEDNWETILRQDEMHSDQAVCFLKVPSKCSNVQGRLSRVLKDNGNQRGFWCWLKSKPLPTINCVLSEPELDVLILETS